MGQNKGRLTALVTSCAQTAFSRHFIEGNKRKDRRNGKTWKKSEHLLDERKETRRYWKLKQEALDRTACKTRYERRYGRVARQNNYKNCFVLQLYIF
jgi:hypothetical protein